MSKNRRTTDTDVPTVAEWDDDAPHSDLTDTDQIHDVLAGAESHLDHLRDLADQFEAAWRTRPPAVQAQYDRPPHRDLREACDEIEDALTVGDESDRAQLVRGLKASPADHPGYTAATAAKRLRNDVADAVEDLRDTIPRHRRLKPRSATAGDRTNSTRQALEYLAVLAKGRDPTALDLDAAGWSL